MSDDQYKARMQRKKEHIDSRIEEANIDKGIIVLLTGNGKGKSSSSLGMVCRALGYDMKVGIVKFLKGVQDTGEDAFLAKQPNVQTAFMKTGFTWDTQDKEYDTAMAVETWNKAVQYLTDKSINLVVLDELTYMISYKYLDEKMIIDSLNNRPKDQHVVITGRAASDALIDIADTVSEVKDIKHAFRANIKAQKGVDL
ncbi:cob(I)yrinic acid a,c-diamide adenosyltransferase [Candidatus Thioglobus sp.]|uniref:cob(I)yrinic acid a,c-diamide adenosyltransferase n=1 Tax=Candidatus Thioglobus sp. TaxID=2026721 RepID=UPI0001BD364F|nr:cob(I)yrinic acid a,c-diamide adenosyltransferase [Candidatus Thioglobus sp.]EEZ80243.1 MAG: ATP:corrinoid adenosyltransferase [uncultured Candidatus Thioglobus sp.]MBT3186150.1 cob(I)yrinic acid a,c-diamide adenosyltransferase [Candidatus Thioglobus sp.]MBT3431148.1 cob(I)yrinic acid a,c-diamide adenosyltransferase [Candidatus Thioglobus sp.]MBT6655800.1 cob(I)yrinic acid a,c-diamide adenosyltransferase [Candidatus Thioglobus sp.]